MKLFLINFLLAFTALSVQSQSLLTKFERTDGLETVTYEEGIHYFMLLDSAFEETKLMSFGKTDSGHPLHLLLVSKEKNFSIQSLKEKGYTILFIINGIHPGESDGIDASQLLVRDILSSKKKSKLLDKVVLAIVPFYNVGGALNRNSNTRANQNGPLEYGFRGNARNFDLNRDFIKSDTRNAETFHEIFQMLDPDVFIDNHVSNGADYQYVITSVATQKDKLGGNLGVFLNEKMMPDMFSFMEDSGYKMTPYVNVWGSTPDKGWSQFMDLPRYSSGYAALFQTFSFMCETHMLKPYDQRVQATYQHMLGMISFMNKNADEIINQRKEAREKVKNQRDFPVSWKLDRKNPSDLNFDGYEPMMIPSEVSGAERLKYDRSRPKTWNVPYYNNFLTETMIQKPEYYLIPKSWYDVIEILERNGVKMEPLKKDTVLEVTVYHVEDYSSPKTPWEGHYYHSDVKISKSSQTLSFNKGDILIKVDQSANRFIVETLEPEGSDSFFRWNFFDSILQMKEHFSSYVFEDVAARYLSENPELKRKFDQEKNNNPELANNPQEQLEFIYRETHLEKEYLRYPVFRVE